MATGGAEERKAGSGPRRVGELAESNDAGRDGFGRGTACVCPGTSAKMLLSLTSRRDLRVIFLVDTQIESYSKPIN